MVRDQRKTVFVRNLPRQCAEEDLVEFMSAAGAVVDVRRPLDKEGRIQGWALVQYDSLEAAHRAPELLSGQELMGREVFVELSQVGGGGGGCPAILLPPLAAHCWPLTADC